METTCNNLQRNNDTTVPYVDGSTSRQIVSYNGSAWIVHDPGVGVVVGYELNPTDGSVWAYGAGGVARFDGRSWHVYVDEDGQAFHLVEDVMFAPDGGIWLTDGTGISRLNPNT